MIFSWGISRAEIINGWAESCWQICFVQKCCCFEMTLNAFGKSGYFPIRPQAHLSLLPHACPGHNYFIGLAGLREWFYTSLPNSLFSNIRLVSWNWPLGAYSHHGNKKTLQSRAFYLVTCWLRAVYLHTTASGNLLPTLALKFFLICSRRVHPSWFI